MKVNRKKLELAMARACMSTGDLVKTSAMPRPTVKTGNDRQDCPSIGCRCDRHP